MNPRFTLIWPGGSSITTGNSWEELERMIRAEQWQAYPSRRLFRRALARRAKIWSGANVRIHGSSESFIRALAEADMFMLVDEQAIGES